MSLFILLAIVGGILFGRFVSNWPPLTRRGVPIGILVMGLVLMRQGNREIGLDAVRAGEMSATGVAGLSLVLFGLMALLTLVITFLGREMAKASKHSRRR